MSETAETVFGWFAPREHLAEARCE